MFNLIRSEWRLLLFGFLMTFWSSPGQTFFISLFSGQIRSEFSLSDGEFGAIYSLATLLSAAVIVWSGSLVDSMDLRRFSTITIFGLAFGCILLYASPGVILLVLAIFLLRHFGQGLMVLASSTSMVRYIPAHKGKATALSGMGYPLSEAVMPIVIVSVISWLGWRNSWLFFAVVLIVVMIPCIRFLLGRHALRHENYLDSLVRNAEAPESVAIQRQWTRKEVLKDIRFYIFVPGLMAQQLMFTGFIFHQVHLVEFKGWSLSAWASLFALYAVVSVVTKLVMGMLVDRHGALKLVPWISLPMGAGLVALGLSPELFWGGVFLVLMGVTVGYQSTVTAPFWAELYGTRHLGAIKSLAASTMVLLTATSPVLIGWFIDLGVSIETLALAAAVYVVVTTLMSLYAYKLTVNSRAYELG